ncbi:MAG: YdbH domain-containing protein, partial [Hyphomonadaceae bacterium]
ATGVARLAFQALTRFRYDDLSLELNGDLDGELVTAINFSGRNAGDLDIGAGATGPLQATVAGVPFIFNVRVTAPFRRLSEMAAGAFDPRPAIHRAGQASQKPRPQVDRPAPATE